MRDDADELVIDVTDASDGLPDHVLQELRVPTRSPAGGDDPVLRAAALARTLGASVDVHVGSVGGTTVTVKLRTG